MKHQREGRRLSSLYYLAIGGWTWINRTRPFLISSFHNRVFLPSRWIHLMCFSSTRWKCICVKKTTSTAPSTKCGCSWQPVDSMSVPESLLTQCSHSGGDLEGQDVYKAMLTCWRLLSCVHTRLYTHVLFSVLFSSGMVRGLEPEGRQVGISGNDYKLSLGVNWNISHVLHCTLYIVFASIASMWCTTSALDQLFGILLKCYSKPTTNSSNPRIPSVFLSSQQRTKRQDRNGVWMLPLSSQQHGGCIGETINNPQPHPAPLYKGRPEG